MTNAPTYVILRVLPSLIEAKLAQSKLASENIDSHVENEHTFSMQPHYAQALGGVRLAVKTEDAQAAAAILDRDESEELNDGDEN